MPRIPKDLDSLKEGIRCRSCSRSRNRVTLTYVWKRDSTGEWAPVDGLCHTCAPSVPAEWRTVKNP